MWLTLLSLSVMGYFVAKWFFAEPLRAFLGKLDKLVNRLVNATLIALAIVYCLRLLLWWLGIPEF